MTPVVETNKLSKWYGKIAGVNDLTVKIGAGVTGLLGPNGAGKSTAIKLLSGALRPSKGELKVFGEPVWGNLETLRRIGHCPEHDGIYHDLTAVEFVAAMATLSGLDKRSAQSAASTALDRVKLGDARNRPIGQYSKGMRQRVKLAQAIVHDPDLVLFDEPLTGCDPVARAQIVALIKALGKEGKAVLVSSHILHEIEAMTDQIVLLYKGQVLADGNIYRIREMIDEHPHKVSVRCEHPRQLAAAIVEQSAISAVHFPDDQELLIETRMPDQCYGLLASAIVEGGFSVAALTSPDNNLQSVFEYLTRNRGPEGVADA
ncbi:MAG: ABC transporter ATP-binding protein [Deltaproteobacteria bacterium]|nr:ABC transporter ATP-binding protein [Deltaproteobacteria bacterium]